MQGSSGEADIENRFVDTAGEGEGRTNGENRMETYTLPYIILNSRGHVLYESRSLD